MQENNQEQQINQPAQPAAQHHSRFTGIIWALVLMAMGITVAFGVLKMYQNQDMPDTTNKAGAVITPTPVVEATPMMTIPNGEGTVESDNKNTPDTVTTDLINEVDSIGKIGRAHV